MKLTNFRFFKETPLIDFQNTIHFKSNTERDNFFLNGNHYDELAIEGVSFNFVRDRSTIDLPISYNDMRGVNYCTFVSEFEPNTRYYAYVSNYEYLNDNNVRVYLMVDPIMTYTQGNVLQQLTNLDIQRQHLPLNQYNQNIWELKNNDDILTTNTKNYFAGEQIIFDDLLVVMQSGVDLQSDFGDVDNPKIKTSRGLRFDNVTSPLNLYATDIEDFNKLMGELSEYPWISQNIKSLLLIPRIFMEDNLTKLQFASTETLDVDYLYRVSGLNTKKQVLNSELGDLSFTMNELYQLFGLDPVQDKHLLRNEYTTTELYNYSGGQLFVDNGQLHPQHGLKLRGDIITGHENELKIFVENYRIAGAIYGQKAGAYLNDSLSFNQFDDIPMLLDNFQLSLAKNANQRELAESKLISNRVESVLDPNADLKDRFFNATSLLSNVSMDGLFGKFTDEYEYYRTQKAQQADMALETPSISSQTNGNSFNIANGIFGVHLKFSKPTTTELNKIKKYYKLFGYQLNDSSSSLERVDSMSVANFVQFSGSWTIPNTDVALIEMMKAQFENGVRLWHNNNTPNPMNQNILTNEMVR